MNKLRQKLEKLHDNAQTKDRFLNDLEQITDDFTCQFLIWIATDNNVPIIKEGVTIEQHATELQQYFKENVYNK